MSSIGRGSGGSSNFRAGCGRKKLVRLGLSPEQSQRKQGFFDGGVRGVWGRPARAVRIGGCGVSRGLNPFNVYCQLLHASLVLQVHVLTS